MARTGPKVLVADASVLVKWFVKEPFTRQSLELKEAHVQLATRIVVPSVAKYEVLNALKYSGQFGTDELRRISKDLDNLQLLEIPFEAQYSELSVGIADKFGLTIYDSSYLAIGQERSLPVYSADEKLLEKARDLKFVHHIREYPEL